MRVFTLSLLAAAAQSLLFKALFSAGSLTIWHIAGFSFEAVIVTGFYAFRPSLFAVLSLQVLVGLAFRTANQIKVSYLNAPLIPTDFFLLKDSFWILSWPLIFLAGVLLLIVSGILVFFLRGVQLPRGKNWIAALPAASILFCLFVFPTQYGQAFDYLLRDDLIGIPFLLRERSQSLGTSLSFSIDVAKYLDIAYQRPSRDEVASALSQLEVSVPSDAKSETRPNRNVYVILAESFWEAPSFRSPGANTLDDKFETLWRDGGYKHFLSPTFGGGTANVEFEVLCGIPARSAGKGILFQTTLSNKMNCLPSLLSRLGYRSFAFHAFAPEFYNRTTIFPSIGFEKFFSISDYLEHPDQGEFLADRIFVAESINKAREAAKGQPFFAYMMTVAEHWPYQWIPAYDREYLKKLKLLENKELADRDLIERYLNINRITSKVLAYQISEIERLDPNALIVVAGDHLPEFADDTQAFTHSVDLTDIRYFGTPLIIRNAQAKNLPSDIPAYQIGRIILDELGIPRAQQAHFPYFVPPKGMTVRGVENGATFVRVPTAQRYLICHPGTSMVPCPEVFDWLKSIRTIAIDLTAGSQFSAEPTNRSLSSEK